MQVTERNGEPLSLTKVYTLVVPEYAASGHDGFDCFLDQSVKHCYHEHDQPLIREIVRKFMITTSAKHKCHKKVCVVNKLRMELFEPANQTVKCGDKEWRVLVPLQDGRVTTFNK